MKNQTTKSAPIEIALRHSFSAAAVSLALFIAGCGGGGGSNAPAAVSAVSSPAAQGEAAANSFNITYDSYGMTSPTFLEASKTPQGITLETALASRMTDLTNFKTISRIDIPAGSVSAGTYSLGAAPQANPAFPGALYFFNAHPSTQMTTVGGTITFSTLGSNAGDRVSGSFNAIVQDGADSYNIVGNFDLSIGSSNQVLPAPPAPTLAAGSYDANCSSCHSLGSYDRTDAPDLALKGGRMNAIFTAGQASHKGLVLTAGEITALKVLLNSY